MRGTLQDDSSLSTRSSPIRRPHVAATDVCQVPRQIETETNDDARENPPWRRMLPVPLSSWAPIGGEPWWAGRQRGQWADEGDDRKWATLGGKDKP